jgi:hypothetical protein
MKTSFKNIAETDVAPATPPPEMKDVTPSPTFTGTMVHHDPMTPAVTDEFFSNEGFQGEIDENIIRTPYLSLVHGVGPLSELGYGAGSLLFNKETLLASPVKGEMQPKDGVTVTFLRGFAEYLEDVSNDEYNEGIRPRRFKKESEARAAGLVSKKEKRVPGEERRAFHPGQQWKMLIQGKGEEGFPLEFGGKTYAIGALGLTKGSYWGAGVVLGNFANEARVLKRALNWKCFQLFTKLEKFTGAKNASWTIKAAPGPKNSPEFITWLEQLDL